MQQITPLKLLFKKQVWKQKGEEYRVTGYGGWSWISKTHVHRFMPRLPGNTNANYRKLLPSKCLHCLLFCELLTCCFLLGIQFVICMYNYDVDFVSDSVPEILLWISGDLCC